MCALGKSLKRMVKRAQRPDTILRIEDLWNSIELEVRKKLTTRTPGDAVMDLKDSKNVKPLVSQAPTAEVPILPIKTISQLGQDRQRAKS